MPGFDAETPGYGAWEFFRKQLIKMAFLTRSRVRIEKTPGKLPQNREFGGVRRAPLRHRFEARPAPGEIDTANRFRPR